MVHMLSPTDRILTVPSLLLIAIVKLLLALAGLGETDPDLGLGSQLDCFLGLKLKRLLILVKLTHLVIVAAALRVLIKLLVVYLHGR